MSQKGFSARKNAGKPSKLSKQKSLSTSCIFEKPKLGKRSKSETNLLSNKRCISLTQLNMLGSTKSLEQLDLQSIKPEELFSREFDNFYDKKVRSGRSKSMENKRLAFTAAFKVLLNAQFINDRFTTTDLLQRNPKYCELTELTSNWFEFEIPLFLDGLDQSVFVQYAEEGGYVRLAIDSEQNFNWSDCITEEGFLSASLVRSNLQLTIQKTLVLMNSNIQKDLDTLPDGVNTLTVYCDGSTIVLDINSGEVLVDLIPSIRLHSQALEFFRRIAKSHVSPSHALAKASERPMSDPETLWMLSFASEERKKVWQLTQNQRKLLDVLIELRELDGLFGELSLNHMVTTMFYLVDEINDPYDWMDSDIGERFIDALFYLEEFLDRKLCEHYFVKGANLFTAMGPVTLSQLKDKVRRIVKPSCVACGPGFVIWTVHKYQMQKDALLIHDGSATYAKLIHNKMIDLWHLNDFLTLFNFNFPACL